jgi:hypothetical protein
MKIASIAITAAHFPRNSLCFETDDTIGASKNRINMSRKEANRYTQV